jgi:hypothetical protein
MNTLTRPRQSVSSVEIIQRVIAAVVGGYAVSWAVSLLLARALPMDRYPAVQWAVLASFLIYLVAILWAFRVRPLARMWVWLLGVAGAAAIMAMALGRMPG